MNDGVHKFDDLIPFYPPINRDDPIGFAKEIAEHEEFRTLKYSLEPGARKYTGYQKFVARYISRWTPYNALLVYHLPGSGKCLLPNQKVYLCEKLIPIGKVWKKYSEKNSLQSSFDNVGIWAAPTHELFVKSMELRKNQDNEQYDMKKGRVTRLYKQLISEKVRIVTLADGSEVKTTLIHKLFTNIGWTYKIEGCSHILCPTKDLKSFEFKRIRSISYRHYEGYVYDLEIEKYHNFCTEFVLAHNTCASILAHAHMSRYSKMVYVSANQNTSSNFKNMYKNVCPPLESEGIDDRKRVKREGYVKEIYTYGKFSQQLVNDPDSFNNSLIVIDEVHNIYPSITKERAKLLFEKRTEEGKNPAQAVAAIFKNVVDFIKISKGCKFMFLSGTPLVDNMKEIRHLLELLYAVPSNTIIDEYVGDLGKLPEPSSFNKFFFTSPRENVLKDVLEDEFGKILIPSITKRGRDLFERACAGRISYVGSPDDGEGIKIETPMISTPWELSQMTKKKWMEVERIPRKYRESYEYTGIIEDIFKISMVEMDPFQQKCYLEQLKIEEEGDPQFRRRTLNALVISFPDGSVGVGSGVGKKKKPSGAVKYIKDVPDDEFENYFYPLENLRKYSCKFAKIIEDILAREGQVFVYFADKKVAGADIFGKILSLYTLNGSKFSKNKSTSLPQGRGSRYVSLTGSESGIRGILDNIINSDQNENGEYVKVILGTVAVAEAFSFESVRAVHFATFGFNWPKMSQAMRRATRMNSLLFLPPEERKIDLFLWCAVLVDDSVKDARVVSRKRTMDAAVFENARIKFGTIQKVTSSLRRVAVDRFVNKIDTPAIRELGALTHFYRGDSNDVKTRIKTFFEERSILRFSEICARLKDVDRPVIYLELETMVAENTQLKTPYGFLGFLSVMKNVDNVYYLTPFRMGNSELYSEKELALLSMYSTVPLFRDIISTDKITTKILLSRLDDKLEDLIHAFKTSSEEFKKLFDTLEYEQKTTLMECILYNKEIREIAKKLLANESLASMDKIKSSSFRVISRFFEGKIIYDKNSRELFHIAGQYKNIGAAYNLHNTLITSEIRLFAGSKGWQDSMKNKETIKNLKNEQTRVVMTKYEDVVHNFTYARSKSNPDVLPEFKFYD